MTAMTPNKIEAAFSSLNPTGMYARVELITPQRAQEMLARSKGNRSIRKNRIRRYIQQRKDGKWRLNHQCIAFNVSGALIDGHHRLTMVVESGLDTVFFVAYNVPDEAVISIDDHLGRTMADAIMMAGLGNPTTAQVAVAGVLMDMPHMINTNSRTRDEIIQTLDVFHEGISFACQFTSRLLTRTVRALAARAYYHCVTGQQKQRLEDFFVCVCEMDGSEEKPVDCREAGKKYRLYLTETVGKLNYVLDLERYQKGQTVLRRYLERLELPGNLVPTRADVFPVLKSLAEKINVATIA